jgi:CRP-like cAMP-binding protein
MYSVGNLNVIGLAQRVAMTGLSEVSPAGEGARVQMPERRLFTRGTTIFKQGDAADAAYILESGQVQIFKMVNGRRITLGFVEQWGMFGEMGLIDESPRMAAAFVTEDATCTVLSREAFHRMMEGMPQGMLLVIQSLTKTLRDSGNNLAEARYRIMELERS